MSYSTILEKILDSKDSSVGGGPASALSGAIACGLIGMVARLSMMKCYGLSDSQYIKLVEELDEINFRLLRGIQEDANSYGRIVEALKLPKTSDEEKSIRNEAVNEAGINSVSIQRDNGYLCKRVHKIGLLLKGNSDSNAASDLDIGINFAKVGVDGCVANIRANLPLIKREKTIAEIKKTIEDLETKENYYESIAGRSEY